MWCLASVRAAASRGTRTRWRNISSRDRTTDYHGPIAVPSAAYPLARLQAVSAAVQAIQVAPIRAAVRRAVAIRAEPVECRVAACPAAAQRPTCSVAQAGLVGRWAVAASRAVAVDRFAA